MVLITLIAASLLILNHSILAGLISFIILIAIALKSYLNLNKVSLKYNSENIKSTSFYKKVILQIKKEKLGNFINLKKLSFFTEKQLKDEHLFSYLFLHPFSKIKIKSILIKTLKEINKSGDLGSNNKLEFYPKHNNIKVSSDN